MLELSLNCSARYCPRLEFELSAEPMYFLVIDALTESMSSKLVTSGVEKRGKSLRSGEANWKEITQLALSESCLGVIARLRLRTYRIIASEDPMDVHHRRSPKISAVNSDVVEDLLQAIAAKPHLVLAHEALVGGAGIYEGLDEDEDEEDDDEFLDDWSDKRAREVFGDIEEATRVRTNERLRDSGIDVTPYKRNADASMLALGFLEDQQSNLLFRLYVPAGRMYEEESEQLLRMFHDWLTSVRKLNVRRSGYNTARGRVIEFSAGNRSDVAEFQNEIQVFQKFLSIVEDPDEAERVLIGMGVESSRASTLVASYSKRLRRLEIDVKQERERRSMDIRHQLESELIDEIPAVPGEAISQIVEMMLPTKPQLLEIPANRGIPSNPTVTINQQIIYHVEGVVAQHVAGDVVNGKEANEIQDLIARFGRPADQAELLQSLREVMDGAAPVPERFKAKQKLKGFLMTTGSQAGQLGVNLLQSWIEHQAGI